MARAVLQGSMLTTTHMKAPEIPAKVIFFHLKLSVLMKEMIFTRHARAAKFVVLATFLAYQSMMKKFVVPFCLISFSFKKKYIIFFEIFTSGLRSLMWLVNRRCREIVLTTFMMSNKYAVPRRTHIIGKNRWRPFLLYSTYIGLILYIHLKLVFAATSWIILCFGC